MADSDYYTFSPYPSTMQMLVVDGVEVGQHYTMLDADGRLIYCARVHVHGQLPAAKILSRRLANNLEGPSGPTQQLKNSVLDTLYQANSHSYPYPRELLTLIEDTAPHAALAGRTVVIESVPEGEAGGQVAVDVWVRDQKDDLRSAIALAKHIARNAMRISAEDRRYRDAFEVLTGASGRGEPSPEMLEQLLVHIAGATSWVTGQPARVGDSIEARLSLNEVSADLRGTLHIFWRDPDVSAVDVHLDGGLPAVEPSAAATLVPEEKGVLAFLKTLGELKVGDAEVDEKFIIRTVSDKDSVRGLIVHCREHLVALARFRAHVEFDAELLRVRINALDFEPTAVAELIDTLLEMWRRMVLYRAGLAGDVDPTA